MATANAIAEAYARRIQRGVITIDDVPERMRKPVQEILGKTS